ncbi:helix-turn-helix domain-containing protein [Streptomyces laculatispora]|uniref:helix-turn-helix domain-containing protein n=1 Tax=Streptomyces laculatispora TaxID=887464 RepID=UPI003518B804
MNGQWPSTSSADSPRWTGSRSATHETWAGVLRTPPVVGILCAFIADHAHLSLSDLARRAGLPVSIVHRMLGELLTWGALERMARARLGTAQPRRICSRVSRRQQVARRAAAPGSSR